jgi:hypothetical protein
LMMKPTPWLLPRKPCSRHAGKNPNATMSLHVSG